MTKKPEIEGDIPEGNPTELIAGAIARANEAEELADELERAVRDGDEAITHETLATQKSLASFMRLQVEATKKKAAKIQEAARRKALRDLRTEVEEYGTTAGDSLAKLLEGVAKAEAEFFQAGAAHNRKYAEWRKRAIQLGAREWVDRPVAPVEDEQVGIFGEALKVGLRRIERFNFSPTADVAGLWRDFLNASPEQRLKVLQKLRTIAAEEPLPTASHFYRNPAGSVFAFDNPLPDEHVKRDALVRITRKDAWGR